ncbi:MAG: peptidoglycan -binding protein [Azospirillaceae bacterium]|nr:peptidoglycan -binding protein [Azospirillaceae bacterium]
MPSPRGRRRAHRAINAWPGWVDGLSSLLMVVIFLLMVFVVAQFYLSGTLTGRDEALSRLNRQIAQLADMLAMERESASDMKSTITQLSADLQNAAAERARLTATLAQTRTERDALSARLAETSARLGDAGTQSRQTEQQLADAEKQIEVGRETITLHLREIASLEADLEALRSARDQLEQRLAAVTAQQLAPAERQSLLQALGAERDRSKQLSDSLASAQEKTMLAQKEIDQRDIRFRDLMVALDNEQTVLAGEKKLTTESQAQVALLNQQVAALRDQLQQLNHALEASEAKTALQQNQITDLGQRLNLALANKVEELARYRSEFFGRLRETLGDRPDIRIVGDRFVFQSEVLFPTGSAEIEDSGKVQLAALAKTLIEIAGHIPSDVNWILRVDGHTDARPIKSPAFPSNWELSAARAISVVKFLTDQGIAPERLAAAGFGEFQPIDSGTSDAALARNRRIELKLDQR